MAFHVRDRETDQLVRKLSASTGKGLTDAVRMAVRNELDRIERETPLSKRLAPIVKRVAARKVPVTETDKEFWDSLSGDY